ncbi:putative Integral membrane protein [Seiridium cardinale]
MAEDLEYFRARLNGAAISTYVLVMLVVPLKLWCRASSGGWRNLGLDDYLSVLALGCANVFFYICMYGMGPYLARHALSDVQLAEVIDFLRFLFAGQLLYVVSLAMIKYTILAFYWRLLCVRARIPILIAVFIVTAWALSIICLVIFTCSPIEAQWDLTIVDSKCISLGVVYVSGSIPNVVTDVIILLLPIPYVWRLQAPLAQRFILGGMFMLGCFVSVVPVVRLTILVGIPLSSSDVTYNTKEVIIWSIVEINIGLVSACLPSMKRALSLLYLDRLIPGSTGRNTTPDPNGFAPTTRAVSERSRGQQIKRLSGRLLSSFAGMTMLDDDEDSYQMIHATHQMRGKNVINVVSSRRRGDSDTDVEDPEMCRSHDGGISIQRQWSVLVHERNKREK